MPIAIGVDIGGSHISSAAVDMSDNKIIKETYFYGEVESKSPKKKIFQQWSGVINATLDALKYNDKELLGIGLAMPGPFKYKDGIALFKGNDKYESLYGISVLEELPVYLDIKIPLRFINDASAFGIGCALMNKDPEIQRVVAITLGTGLGAAFLKNTIPMIKGKEVPEDGCLWNKDFEDGMADDYFSTRWFISKYKKSLGKNGISGVKDLIELKEFDTKEIFAEFAQNMSRFMLPYLDVFETDLVILGGSISKANQLFLPSVLNDWKDKSFEIPVKIVENTEEAGIIGSSYLFQADFWKKVQHQLPEI